MKAGAWIVIVLACYQHSFSQNLVPNAGFEYYFKCPGSFNSITTGEFAPGWISPTTGTPDLFNKCSAGEAGIPANWAGRSNAYVGSGYAGIYCFINGGPKDYREYLQAQLTAPLEEGASYLVEFYYKLSSNSRYSIDRIGFLLSDSTIRSKGDEVLPVKASYEKINYAAYSRTSGLWTRFYFVYIAKGGEKFITIGNFSDKQKTRNQFIENGQGREPMLARAAYYYIDEVKVVLVSGGKPVDPPKPPPLTGYPDIKTDEDYVLKNIQFKYNDYTLLESSFTELKKLLEIMEYNKTWKVVVSGHTDDIGSDAFNIELSRNRATSVADYLISQGIDPARVKTQGFGKQTPLVKGTDEASRSTNRRVELRFLN